MENSITTSGRQISSNRAIFLALTEVIFIRLLVFGTVLAVTSPKLFAWQMDRTGYVYSAHAVFILLPIAWLLITRRDLAEYGLSLRNWRAELKTALSCFLPFAVAGATLGFLPYTQPWGAVVVSMIQVALLFWVAHSLRKPDPKSGLLTIFLAAIIFSGYGFWKSLLPTPSQAIFSFIFYFIFVGFGEEILYRGYIQTRLNKAFGTPWRFLGVEWGWGIVITSLLFGLSHVMNGIDLRAGVFNPQWWWALWTFFGGFVFSFLRQKTGSIVAPAIVHGLPQALVYLFLRI
jgi:uncharacterized protein